MLQDVLGAFIIIAVIWLVFRLAFGGGSESGSSGTGRGGSRPGVGPTKESAAVKAWLDGRGDREKELKKRKQELLEAAKRKYLEKGTAEPTRSGHSGSGTLVS